MKLKCIFCKEPLRDCMQYLKCEKCQPAPYFFTDLAATFILSIEFRIIVDEIKYVVSQAMGSNEISIFEVFISQGREGYNPTKPLRIKQQLTPDNAETILKKVLNMKAFL